MRLSEEAREKRKIYYREYYKNNKDKVKKAQERYWERKAQNND